MAFSILKPVRRAVGRMGGKFRTPTTQAGARKGIILAKESSFHVKEAYKVLRTNIIFSLPMEGCKRVIVTSALPSEGKSTTSLNLAITFAETGARVLLIDADLRRPNISLLLGMSASPGLSNALVKLNRIEDVVRPSGFENLDVVLSGDIPPNPAELLGSTAMEEILEYFSKSYDYIFLDTCPVNVVADTSILSKFADGVVVVIQRNQSEKDVVQDAVSQLQFVGAKILGVVLNRMNYSTRKRLRYRPRGNYRHQYSQYGYYQYAYHAQELEKKKQKRL